MTEKCVFCGKEATQKHHVKYDPEMSIPICVPCHLRVHEHGVGLGEGSKSVHEFIVEEEAPLHPPHFLKTIEKESITYVVTKDDEEVVAHLICPNGCKLDWQLWYSPKRDEFFLRCPYCGYDLIIGDMKEHKPQRETTT